MVSRADTICDHTPLFIEDLITHGKSYIHNQWSDIIIREGPDQPWQSSRPDVISNHTMWFIKDLINHGESYRHNLWSHIIH